MKAITAAIAISFLAFTTLLILVVATPKAEAQQNVTAGLANLTVLASANGTAFDPLTGLGQLLFVGQVLNNDTIASNATNVTTQLFSPNGQLIGFSTTSIPSLEPGAIGNFEQKFTDLDIVGGTPNVLFYQHDTNKASVPFFGFIPPPPLLTGAAAGAIPGGAGGGATGAAAGGAIGGGGSFAGGGGGGGTTINQEIINCIQNQANTANNVSGGATVGQNNFAVCKGKIIQQLLQKDTGENKTTPTPEPTTNQSLAAFTGDTPPQQAADQVVIKPTPPIENSTSPIENTTSPSNNLLATAAPQPLQCQEGFEDVDGECVPICAEGFELVDNECQPIEQQQQEPTDTLALQQSNQEPTNNTPDEEQQQQDEEQQQQEEDNGNNNNNND
jgi:hypothetical protein